MDRRIANTRGHGHSNRRTVLPDPVSLILTKGAFVHILLPDGKNLLSKG